jgi:hypothetical protein
MLTPDRDKRIQEQLKRLDDLDAVARGVLARGQLLVDDDGQVVTDPATGKPIPDPHIISEANEFLAKIARSRARLLGTDPPTVILVPKGTRLTPDMIARIVLQDDDDTDDY